VVAFATSATSRARRRGLRGPGAVDETNTRSPPALEQWVDCISQWAHVGDELLTPSPVWIGLELSAVWTVRFSA
jgi:hypothetical protein